MKGTAFRCAAAVIIHVFISWPSDRFLVAEARNNFYNDTDCGPASELQTFPNEEFPWGVRIQLFTEKVAERTFLGTILDQYTVLTDFKDTFKSGDNSENLRIYPVGSYKVIALNQKFTISNVSHITFHPNYSWPRPDDWPNARNDFALFHLENPIPFDSGSKPVCLPKDEEDVRDLSEPGKRLLLAGANKQDGYGNIKTLIFMVNGPNVCAEEWASRKYDTGTAPYVDRVCANPLSGQNSTRCLHISAGLYSIDNTTKGIKLIGFTSNYYSYRVSSTERICNEHALYFFNIFTNETINWIKNSLSCEPDEVLCGLSTQCVSKYSLCNETQECDNGWDENSKLCNAMNFCETDSYFKCSTYEGCIPKVEVCNGVINCNSGRDEDEDLCRVLNHPSWQLVTVIIVSIAGFSILLSMIAVLWKKWRAAKRFKTGLTKEEIQDFLDGDSSFSAEDIEECPANKRPYDKSYEVNIDDQLSLDFEKVLGEGEFGTVYHGWIQSVSEGEDVPMKTEVAVKTFRKGASPSHFTALLSELKILTYIGSHENVVSLHGACTKDIQKRVIFIAVEFCARGSLEKYLRENRERFQEDSGLRKVVVDENRVKGGYVKSSYVKMGDFEFVPSDLLVWSVQIAKGMNYVSSLRVIHGDLAARNVLLDAFGNAKICDFGLAHKLYSNRNYVRDRNSDTLIPLWWAAPESLQDGKFSSKSDVWSFGVTLWEIFSLGHIPNYGLSDIQLLLNKLKSNERLPKPDFSSTPIYEIMRKCWKWAPSERPDFNTLQETLTSLNSAAEHLTDSGISLNECVWDE